MSLCVYALVSASDSPRRLAGIERERLHAITVGRVSAIVGELRRTPRPTAAVIRAYDRVLRALAERTPAILPARFGTCMNDVDELRSVLQLRQNAFRRSLQGVRGRVQMTVRIPQLPTANRPLAANSQTVASSGAAFLKARAAAAADARAIPGFDPLRAAVRRWVRDERVERHGRLVSVYHLVPRGSAGAYRRTLERAAVPAGLRLLVSGPYPPYAFSTTF